MEGTGTFGMILCTGDSTWLGTLVRVLTKPGGSLAVPRTTL